METLAAPSLPPGPGLQFREQMVSPSQAQSQSQSQADAVTPVSPPSRLDRHHHQLPNHHQSQSAIHHQSQPQSQHPSTDRMPPSHSHADPRPQFAPSPAVFRSYPPAPTSQDSLTSSTSLAGAVSAHPTSQSGNETFDTKTSAQSSLSSPQQRSGDRRLPAPIVRVRTPEKQLDTHARTTQLNGFSHGERSSPIAMASPSMRHKRTASGFMKAPSAVSPIPTNAILSSPLREKRAESVSSSGSRAGEAAAQLKTRLAYAMAKVQHGWQNHNIDQVELLASKLPGRSAASSPSAALISPRSAMTNGASRLTMGDARPIAYPSSPRSARSPPSKSRSSTGIVSWAGGPAMIPPPSPNHGRQDDRTANGATAGPSLAPAADIRPSTSSSTATVTPQHRNSNSVETTPTKQHARLPTTPRSKPRSHVPAHLRTTPTSHAQAEQEAIASLMLMHSPSGSAKIPAYPYQPHSASQPSPRRNEIQHLEFLPVSASQPLPATSDTSHSRLGLTNGARSPLKRQHTSDSRASASSEFSAGGLSQDGAAGRGSETKEDRERLLDEVEDGSA